MREMLDLAAQKGNMGIHYSKFAVGDAPYCVWGPDLPDQNMRFLESLDPDFFSHMAEVHGTALNNDHGKKHSALALRLFYSHALETMLSLLCAAAQAPDCVVGWICLYREEHLKSTLNALSVGSPILLKLNLEEPTWDALGQAIHSFIDIQDKAKEKIVKESFAEFWADAAHAYANEKNRLEYNSIKHGLRARSGGHTLRKRREKSPGVPDPSAPVRTLAASEFGSSFYVPDRIGDSKVNLSLRRYAVNWSPQGLIDGLILASMSISNVVGFLRAINGVDPSAIDFVWPKELELFESARAGAPGYQSSSFHFPIKPGEVKLFTKKEILEVYEEKGSTGTPNSCK